MTRSQSTRRTRRSRVGMALAAAATGLALTACSAGQLTQTSLQRPVSAGQDVDAGTMKIVNAHIAAPPRSSEMGTYESGQNAEINMLVVNNGDAADQIVSIEVDGSEAEIDSGADSNEIPAKGKLVFGTGGEGSISVPINKTVHASETLPIVVTFEEAGEVSFNIPVATDLSELPRDADQEFDLDHH